MYNGIWEFSFKTPMGAFTMDLHLEANGNSLTGHISGKINKHVEITNGTIEGDKITFQAKLKGPVVGYFDSTTTLTISGGTMTGSTQTRVGAFPATATRKEPEA